MQLVFLTRLFIWRLGQLIWCACYPFWPPCKRGCWNPRCRWSIYGMQFECWVVFSNFQTNFSIPIPPLPRQNICIFRRSLRNLCMTSRILCAKVISERPRSLRTMITLKSKQDPFETWNKLIGPSKNGLKPK